MVDHSNTPDAVQGLGTDIDGASDTKGLPQDFESALAQLESLVSHMENGSLPLDQSLAAYQKGVELARICQRLLDSAEEQVKVLQGNLLKPLDEIDSSSSDAS